MNDISDYTNDIHQGDAADTLAELPESSVHMVMTSPPYFGLRDYGDETNEVWGGDDDCDHEWTDAGTVKRGGQNTDDNPPDVGGNAHAQDTGIRGDGVSSDECRKCGAWRGQLGLEPKLDRFIDNLVDVFREVRRVLRPDGSAWLNLGDSYAQDEADEFGRKNKMLVPHRVAIALQEDGWIVRNDATWAKPNPMPSSVKDRLNTTTEQVFHLVPEPDYWYDLDAIREPHAETTMNRGSGSEYSTKTHTPNSVSPNKDADNVSNNSVHPAGKNPGDVFEVTTKPFPDAHFAVYPPELVEKPLKATCPPTVCAECGSPYERDVEREPGEYDYSDRSDKMDGDRARTQSSGTQLSAATAVHKGWNPACDCDTDVAEAGIALDPFAGAGTTALVAKRHGRRFIGIDLNEEYVAMAQKRLGLTVDNPQHVRADADVGLEEWT